MIRHLTCTQFPDSDGTVPAAALWVNASEFGMPFALVEIMVPSSEHRNLGGCLSGMSIGVCSGSVLLESRRDWARNLYLGLSRPCGQTLG